MKLVSQAIQSIGVQRGSLAGLETSEQHSRTVDAARPRLHVHRRRCAAKEHRSRHATCGLYGTKSRLLDFKDRGFSPLAVNVTVDYGIPAGAEIVNQLVARTAVVQRQTAGQNHEVLVVVLPQSVEDFRHQLQHAAGALKSINGCPLFVEFGKDLGVDRVTLHHPVKVAGLLCFLGHL